MLLAAAFGDRPGAPVRVPCGAAPRTRWLAAVALGGQGRYAGATALLHGLLTDPAAPPGARAHAAVTLAAHRRQLGGHAAAHRCDALGLRLAGCASPAAPDAQGTDPAAARADALVGLAADAIGLGDPAGAARLLGRAESPRHPSWRPAVRAGWVRAELALLTWAPETAEAPAAAALAAAEAGGSVRHVLKSRLVCAVVGATTGHLRPDAAAAELDAVADAALRHGQWPLVWPAALAAADVLGCGRHANESGGRSADRAPNDSTGGAARRRHAAAAALNVIHSRADPDGRRRMGESPWIPGWQSVV